VYDVLEGVKVVELAEWLFAPSCAAILADWGADVIKIERPPAGDSYRGIYHTGVVSPAMELANRGKRSMSLNVATEDGKEILTKLIANADVFITSMLPASRKRLGVELEDIRAMNPNIIYVRATGQGARGPDAELGGFDISSAWARSGMCDYLTPPDAVQPVQQPGGIGDCVAGLSAAGAIAASLYRRERTGQPAEVDVSLLHGAFWMFSIVLMMEANSNLESDAEDNSTLAGLPVQKRFNRHEGVNPLVNPYRTKDGRWIWLVVLQPDPHWQEFCKIMQDPELVEPRFASFESRRQNFAELVSVLDRIFASSTCAEWVEKLSGFSGIWRAANTPREALEDPQVAANGYLAKTEGGSPNVVMVTSPAQFDGRDLGVVHRSPEYGQHTEEVLLELGYDWDGITSLLDRNALQ
jgi:crotonobetainyl-CoA:carnitine CoA-transferase CaiB-like acyl-CoA transferase